MDVDWLGTGHGLDMDWLAWQWNGIGLVVQKLHISSSGLAKIGSDLSVHWLCE
jgi:hypothetical protein